MFKTKDIVAPEPPKKKVKKVQPPTVSVVDLTPLLSSYKELGTKVDQLIASIPASFDQVNNTLSEYKPKEVEEDYETIEGFKNINSKLFEINDILVRFVATQKEFNNLLSNTVDESNGILKALKVHEEGRENKILLEILTLVQQLNQTVGNKSSNKEWNFQVIRDQNGNMQSIKALTK